MENPINADAYSRLSCRVSSKIKHRAEEAAALLGQSMTDFTEVALAERAQLVLDSYSKIAMSERDFNLFVESLSGGDKPTPSLLEAVKELRRLEK